MKGGQATFRSLKSSASPRPREPRSPTTTGRSRHDGRHTEVTHVFASACLIRRSAGSRRRVRCAGSWVGRVGLDLLAQAAGRRPADIARPRHGPVPRRVLRMCWWVSTRPAWRASSSSRSNSFGVRRHGSPRRVTRWASVSTMRSPELEHRDLAVRRHAVAQRGADARHQFGDAEGLVDIVVGPEVERRDLLVLAVARRQDHDRHLRGRPDGARSRPCRPCRAGRGRAGPCRAGAAWKRRSASAPVERGRDREAGRRQRGPQEALDLRLVVDDQNGFTSRHGRSTPSSSGDRQPSSTGRNPDHDAGARARRDAGLSARMVPPMASTTPLAIARPSPVPAGRPSPPRRAA